MPFFVSLTSIRSYLVPQGFSKKWEIEVAYFDWVKLDNVRLITSTLS